MDYSELLLTSRSCSVSIIIERSCGYYFATRRIDFDALSRDVRQPVRQGEVEHA